MPYADITFQDKNPIKRWLQRRRLVSAIDIAGSLSHLFPVICDFGAGNGELCKFLAASYSGATIICYEPTSSLLAEARDNLRMTPGITYLADIRQVAPGTLDLIFCLEVLEHLPPEETMAALSVMHNILKPSGKLIVGVPVEIGPPALYKGLFRMSRRYGEYDATFVNVALSLLFRPPQDRPISEIEPGLRFFYQHMGFDHRVLRTMIDGLFTLEKISASPFPSLGPLLNPEVYFVAAKHFSTN